MGFPNKQISSTLSRIHLVVYSVLQCDDVMHEGRLESSKRLNLLCDEVTRHYHVIVNLTGAMAKRYVCIACSRGCDRDMRHICDQTCRNCMAKPTSVFEGTRNPCGDCNRNFRSRSCFANHKKHGKKCFCDRKRCWKTCGGLITRRQHECKKTNCQNCNENKEIWQQFFMKPLQNLLPVSKRVLFVFYDSETTQNTKYSDSATVHVPNLVCL